MNSSLPGINPGNAERCANLVAIDAESRRVYQEIGCTRYPTMSLRANTREGVYPQEALPDMPLLAFVLPLSVGPIPKLDVSSLGIISNTVPDSDNKVFIGGLPYNLTDEQVRLKTIYLDKPE